MGINQKRRGKFMVSSEFLESAPTELQQIMANCIVVRCEFLHAENAFLYHAYSEMFDEVEAGVVVPQYGWRFFKDKEGNISFETKRME